MHIGREVFLDLTDKLIIEESVGIAMRAVLLTHILNGRSPFAVVIVRVTA